MYRNFLGMLSILAVVLIGVFNCSSEPCDDLKSKAEGCLDDEVKSLLLRVSQDGDKQECKDYLDSYYYTFESRCSASLTDASSTEDITLIEDTDASL